MKEPSPGSYRKTVEAYMRRRNEQLPPEKRLVPEFLDSLFDLGIPVFYTVARNFDDLRQLPGTAQRTAELLQGKNDPGPWLEEARDRETGPQRLVLDYILRLRTTHRTIRPPGRKAEEKPLEVDDAYVPLTTATPRNPERESEAATSRDGERRKAAFSRIFEDLASEFQGVRAARLMGGPGCGKTTAARQLAWRLAQRYHIPGLPRGIVPLWLPLRNLEGMIPQGRDGRLELESFLISQAAGLIAGIGKAGTGEGLLDSGRPLLWILDGFDEIASKDRQDEAAAWVRKLIQARDQDFFLVTSRYFGERRDAELGLQEILLSYHLDPLDDHQQEAFIDNYLEQIAPGKEAGPLHETIRRHERHSAEERQMSRNPLLLSLMCYVYAREGALPADWDDLFEKFLTLFLIDLRREVKQGQTGEVNYSPEGSRKVLEQLAWSLQSPAYRQSAPERELRQVAKEALEDKSQFDEEDRAEMPLPKNFLRLMREHAGLLAYQGEEADHLGFLLRPIQEYLAACHAVARGKGEELAELFNRKAEDQREVTRLAMKRSGSNATFRKALFGGLLKGRLDENDDVFLGRLVSMAREDAIATFVRAIKDETDRRRQGRLLGFVRKFRTESLKQIAESLKDHEETKWHALAILTEPGKKPPAEGDTWVEETTEMCFVRIPAGKFQMGDGKEQRGEEIAADFWMGQCAVTNGEYGIYLREKQVAAPDYWSDPRFNGEYQPVVGVSWDDADAFCAWLREQTGAAIRLPTEEKWEYACRACSTTLYCFGDGEEDLNDHAWFYKNANGSTHVAGVKRPNGWGLYDMHGNVWEWSDSFYEYSANRVFRGGSWADVATVCRSAFRVGFRPDYRYGSRGFRVCLAPGPAEPGKEKPEE